MQDKFSFLRMCCYPHPPPEKNPLGTTTSCHSSLVPDLKPLETWQSEPPPSSFLFLVLFTCFFLPSFPPVCSYWVPGAFGWSTTITWTRRRELSGVANGSDRSPHSVDFAQCLECYSKEKTQSFISTSSYCVLVLQVLSFGIAAESQAPWWLLFHPRVSSSSSSSGLLACGWCCSRLVLLSVSFASRLFGSGLQCWFWATDKVTQFLEISAARPLQTHGNRSGKISVDCWFSLVLRMWYWLAFSLSACHLSVSLCEAFW